MITGPNIAVSESGYAGINGSMTGGVPVGGAALGTIGGSMASGGGMMTSGTMTNGMMTNGMMTSGVVNGTGMVPAGAMATTGTALATGGVPMGTGYFATGGAPMGTGYSVGGAMLPGGGAMHPVAPPGGACGCGPGATAGECTGAACGAETMCCEAEGGAVGIQWVQVPGGSYSAVTSYQFVGEGTGNYERRVVTTWYGWRFRKCCIGLCALLLLLPLLYLLLSLLGDDEDETVTITTPGPNGKDLGTEKTCLIFGDPHALTFDGQRADYYTPGEYYIVKTPNRIVSIQGKYQPTRMTNGLAVTKEVGISGSFIGDNKLVIGADFITFNNQPIQQGFDQLGFEWTHASGINIAINNQGTVMQESRAGKALHVVHLELPNEVKMEVNRWSNPQEGSYINVRLTMHPMGQDGHCGNFNGVAEDDRRTAVRARLGKFGVPQNELIFPGTKTVINPGNRPDPNDCPEGALKAAMETCKASENKFFPSTACIIDTCLGHLQPQMT